MMEQQGTIREAYCCARALRAGTSPWPHAAPVNASPTARLPGIKRVSNISSGRAGPDDASMSRSLALSGRGTFWSPTGAIPGTARQTHPPLSLQSTLARSGSLHGNDPADCLYGPHKEAWINRLALTSRSGPKSSSGPRSRSSASRTRARLMRLLIVPRFVPQIRAASS